jgi:hypothetical protein
VELHQGGQPWLSFVQNVGKTDPGTSTGGSGEVLAGSADGRLRSTKLGLKDMPEYCCEESVVSVFLTRMDGKVVTIVDACTYSWNELMDYGQDVYFGRSQIEGSQDGAGARYTIGFTITVHTQSCGRFNDFDDYDSDYDSDEDMVPIGATVQFIDDLDIYDFDTALGGLDEFNLEKDTMITSAPELLQLLERPCSAHRWK